MNAPIRTMPAVSPALEMLLLTHPLIRVLNGAKRETYMRAWTRLALAEARNVLGEDPRALPDNPKAALMALYLAVLEMGAAIGVDHVEFIDILNQHREDLPRQGIPEGISRVTERAVAMFALFVARRLEQQL